MNRVVWATVAADDFREILEYLQVDSPEAARTFVDRIDASIKQLRTHPRIGRIVPELQRQNITRYREVVIAPWRLFYRTEKDMIYIISLIDGRRNIQEIILRRILR